MILRTNRGPVIGYAEVPDLHVAVARRVDPTLVGRPIVVGGDPAKRGKVVAASPDLRTLGIDVGMPVEEVLTRTQDAVWIQTDMGGAREVSGLFRAALRQAVPAVELDGMGGAYWEAPLDADESLALADRIIERVADQTALPLRVGIAPVRFAARWAAEDAGESEPRFLTEEEFDRYLLRQPIERFPGVGPKTAARLAELGANDVSSLRSLGLERLEILLGNHGRALWMLASGNDPKPLRVRRHPTSLSREKSFPNADVDGPELMSCIDRLADSLGSALLREGLGAGRIALRLTYLDSRTQTRSLTLGESVSSAGSLATAARDLLLRAAPETSRVRKLGIVVAGLEIVGAEQRQLGLF